MATETKTSVGTVEVRQTASNEIEIRLKPSDGHPGKVTVKVVNEISKDEAKLLWIK